MFLYVLVFCMSYIHDANVISRIREGLVKSVLKQYDKALPSFD